MIEFKFIIYTPKFELDSDEKTVTFAIHATYPTVLYKVSIPKEKKVLDDEYRRLAIAELKIKLIKDISNAEFELETE